MKVAFLLFPLISGCAAVPSAMPAAPVADFHQHLVSPAFAPVAKMPRRDASDLLLELDQAGIPQAVVLSVGYSFADERKALPDPDRLTREENDWTSRQVSAHAARLIGFCSANPLRTAALQELDRCLQLPGMKGIKLHFGNAGITLRDPAHLEEIKSVFALAQRRSVTVLVHMRARGGTNYGAEDARLFVEQVMPVAPGIEVIVAHLGASSPDYSAQNDEVMAALADYALRKDRRVRNLYVDVSANVTADISAENAILAAKRMRDFGLTHILYGSDLTPPGGSIAAGWEIFRSKLPLTPQEAAIIAGNRPRFFR